MGAFLKELRKSKNLTMAQLNDVLNKEWLGVTIKSISDWESGATIPELEKLLLLASFYGVTIDEILDGERSITKKDLDKKYHIFQKEFDDLCLSRDPNDKQLWFDTRTKYVELMNKNVKQLIICAYLRQLSHNEDLELEYLFKRKYKLSEYYHENYKAESSDEYLNFLRVIKDLKNNPNIKNKEEFYWEIQKYIEVSCEFACSMDFYGVCDEELFTNHFIHVLLKQSEPWELDSIVAGFQNFDSIAFEHDNNSKFLQRYKEKHGKEFNKEAITKATLKYLLEQGGMINPYFFCFYQKKKKRGLIIDRLEELYKLCIKPIEVNVFDSENHEIQKTYYAKNTTFNRFLRDYYDYRFALGFYSPTSDLKPLDVYDILNNDPDNKKAIAVICKNKKIDINRDEQYVMADLKFDLNHWNDVKNRYFDLETNVKNGLIEIRKLEELLNRKEKYYYTEYIEEVGPKKINEIKSYSTFWKSQLSLEDFKKERRKDLTMELLNNIDKLSMKEIRAKYFPKETLEEEAE